MVENEFKHVESVLYNYYRDMKKKETLQLSLRSSKEYRDRLQKRFDDNIPTMDYDVALPKAINYNKLAIMCSGDGTSPQERGMIKQIDDLKNNIARINYEIINTEDEISRLIAINSLISSSIMLYTKEEQLIFKSRYGNKKTYDEMSREMNLATSSICEKVHKRVKDLADMLKFQNYKIAE